MKRQTVEIIIILILGVVFLLMVNKYRQMPEAPVVFTSPEAAVSEKLPPSEPKGEIEYTSVFLRDPLEMPEAAEKKLVKVTAKTALAQYNFVLKAISLTEGKPKAIINDKVVGIGDAVNGGTVSEITKEGVRIKTETEEILLKIE